MQSSNENARSHQSLQLAALSERMRLLAPYLPCWDHICPRANRDDQPRVDAEEARATTGGCTMTRRLNEKVLTAHIAHRGVLKRALGRPAHEALTLER